MVDNLQISRYWNPNIYHGKINRGTNKCALKISTSRCWVLIVPLAKIKHSWENVRVGQLLQKRWLLPILDRYKMMTKSTNMNVIMFKENVRGQVEGFSWTFNFHVISQQHEHLNAQNAIDIEESSLWELISRSKGQWGNLIESTQDPNESGIV